MLERKDDNSFGANNLAALQGQHPFVPFYDFCGRWQGPDRGLQPGQ